MKPTPPDHSIPQPEFQAAVDAVIAERGFLAGLDWMNDYARAIGYIEDWMIESNEWRSFHDDATDVTYRLQINRTRSRYNPAATPQVDADGNPLPDLHCPLCIENVGRPGKEELRVYEFTLGERRRPFFIQLTPFPLRVHHFILIHRQPIPMNVERDLLEDLFDFLALAPTFTVCSNSDVEWAGASILTHLHYQVFKDYPLPIMEARPAQGCSARVGDVDVAMLDYPCPVLRLSGVDPNVVLDTATRALREWRERDPGRNTFNVVLSRDGDRVALNLIHRNPDHLTPPELQAIKSEGVGVIEMAGEGIYPDPTGDGADERLRRMRQDGLPIIKGIMAGNGPFSADQYEDRFQQVIDSLQ